MATDGEIRGRALAVVYELRHANGGWVPVSETNFAGMAPITHDVIRTICDHLGQAGLIDWKPGLGGRAAGMARITGRGVDVFERKAKSPINITLPDAGRDARAPDSWDVAAQIVADQYKKPNAAVQSTIGKTEPLAPLAPPPGPAVGKIVAAPEPQGGAAPQPIPRNDGTEALTPLGRMIFAELFNEKAPPGSSVRTSVGSAIQKNQQAIELAIATLSILVDQKLASLKDERPNSPESQADLGRALADYQGLKSQIEALREAVATFAAAGAEEENLVKSSISLAEGISNYWTERHMEICKSTFESALFVASMTVCSLTGCGALPTAVCGVLAGGKPVLEAIRAFAKSDSGQK